MRVNWKDFIADLHDLVVALSLIMYSAPTHATKTFIPQHITVYVI